MDSIKNAAGLLEAAESRLQELIAAAVGSGDFIGAKTLIDAVAALAGIRSQLASAHSRPIREVDEPTPAGSKPHSRPATGIARNVAELSDKPILATDRPSYPQFQRDGSRLIKIGWSTKEKKPYEHRVERDSVTTIARTIADKFRSKRPIKLEKILPIRNHDGAEIPNYQAYLVLKWLQQFSIVERRGQDGYVLRDENLETSKLEEIWSQTPQRK